MPAASEEDVANVADAVAPTASDGLNAVRVTELPSAMFATRPSTSEAETSKLVNEPATTVCGPGQLMTTGAFAGPPPQGVRAALVLRGFGAPVVKSTAFWSVSVHPFALRSADVVFEGALAGPPPSKKFAVPKPTRSRILPLSAAEQGVEPPLQGRLVVVLARITFPAVAERLVDPVVSADGSVAPIVPPASLTRKCWPGAIEPASAVAAKLPVPLALAYCTDQPLSETVLAPRLNSSMKSFWYVAPALPPPP